MDYYVQEIYTYHTLKISVKSFHNIVDELHDA